MGKPMALCRHFLSRNHLLKLCADSHEQVQCGGIKVGLLTIEIVRSAIPVPSDFRVKRPF
jgi:hypothetical protein